MLFAFSILFKRFYIIAFIKHYFFSLFTDCADHGGHKERPFFSNENNFKAYFFKGLGHQGRYVAGLQFILELRGFQSKKEQMLDSVHIYFKIMNSYLSTVLYVMWPFAFYHTSNAFSLQILPGSGQQSFRDALPAPQGSDLQTVRLPVEIHRGKQLG